ncbi:ZW10 interactor isoform X1 [Ornithorhynchus anatinus]|uniref:ZW10 interactor isoform X1 n=2 Tax=Ornithorhynchus anatinus TaxID=9258 RepID=UPI0010A7976C|nr:ZW10 interactor isoform X1 [Ornithorhynchus anatinus]
MADGGGEEDEEMEFGGEMAEMRAQEALSSVMAILASQDGREEAEAEVPAKLLAEFVMDSRKKDKLLCSQLHVVQFLQDFLEHMDAAPGFHISEEEIRKEANEAKQKWKDLKGDYQKLVEKIEEAMPRVLQQVEALQKKRELLEEALSEYQMQKHSTEEKLRAVQEQKQRDQEQWQHLIVGVKEAHNRRMHCHNELLRLQGEMQSLESTVRGGKDEALRQQALLQLLEQLQGMRLLSVTAKEMVMELSAGPEHLKLVLTWTEDGQLVAKSDGSYFNLAQVFSDASNDFLETQHKYYSQAQILSQIQELQTKFPLDWKQQEWQLRYLKPSCVCTLAVQPGLLGSSSLEAVRLISVEGLPNPPDLLLYKPSQPNPTLQDWLEYLSTTDF